jgi:hypothetical protein
MGLMKVPRLSDKLEKRAVDGLWSEQTFVNFRTFPLFTAERTQGTTSNSA